MLFLIYDEISEWYFCFPATGIYVTITDNEMLSDEHITRAIFMLSAQFGTKIGGLSSPLAVTRGDKVHKVNWYPTLQDELYVQIMNTGKQHWVTAFFTPGMLLPFPEVVDICDAILLTIVFFSLLCQVLQLSLLWAVGRKQM